MNIQDAIDLAAKEDRIVRFTNTDSNDDLRKGIVDLKECEVIKGNPEDTNITILPPSISLE